MKLRDSSSEIRATRRFQEADRNRTAGQAEKILSMLVAAGPRGCMNVELWVVCHAVNSRVADLRKQGHAITAESEGRGIWRYRLAPSEPHQLSPFEERRRREEAEAMPLFSGGAA